MEEEIIRFFNQKYNFYKIEKKLSEDDAVEFAFYDLKNRFGKLNISVLLNTKLRKFLIKNSTMADTPTFFVDGSDKSFKKLLNTMEGNSR